MHTEKHNVVGQLEIIKDENAQLRAMLASQQEVSHQCIRFSIANHNNESKNETNRNIHIFLQSRWTCIYILWLGVHVLGGIYIDNDERTAH